MVTNNDRVFTPLTTPYLTYNKREGERLESNVKHNLEVGGKIIVLSGPSKIGKTVLIKKVIDEDKRIILEGGDLKSVEDLTLRMIQKLSKIPNEITKIESINSNANIDGSASLGAKFWNWAYLRISTKAGSSVNAKHEMIFGDDPFERVTHYMLDRGYTLVIDDFHYIDGTVQREIIRKLKAPLSEGMKVVFALIPSRTEVVIQQEPDMSFRTKVLNVPLWSDDELRYISDRGFEALNTSVESTIIDKFVEK
ncbi:hypothetical protein [Fructobacillus fructosus]|uniref:hypothetical protein n=1 Tax=Fructobacillus fructosus TaxID=1631 RepID=UPI00200B5C1F|nr:hypothetical protein [Fructobacillus fructosus]MCK8639062.1 hypothetical protein [Fructobacillus fructosus]